MNSGNTLIAPCIQNGSGCQIARVLDEVSMLRDCKKDIAVLIEHKNISDEKFLEIKSSISKLFDKIDGGNSNGINKEIHEIKRLLTKSGENINELYSRLDKTENILEKTHHELLELSLIVKTVLETEEKIQSEKSSFRREFRLWIIGFIGTAILTACVNWVSIRSNGNRSTDPIVIDLNAKQSNNPTYSIDTSGTNGNRIGG